MSRDIRKQLAEETLDILRRGNFSLNERIIELEKELDFSEKNTKLYTEENEPSKMYNNNFKTRFILKNCTTNQALEELRKENNLAGLNFASAKNPGGGFKGGSQAQEECLARTSGLYRTLEKIDGYYAYNKKMKSCFYSDRMIFSPQVPFFRDNDDNLIGDYYKSSIITAPAVNYGVIKQREQNRISEVESVMRKRIRLVLDIALENGIEHIVLGAWGCGVFQNDPKLIANLFDEQFSSNERYANAFRTVYFAVLDRKNVGIYDAFQKMKSLKAK